MSSRATGFALEEGADGDGTFDLMFGSTVILLIMVGYVLSTLWSHLVPKRKALLRSLSCQSLSEMPWSARTACITMLAEFDARSDPIAAAAKEAKVQREVSKKSSGGMTRVPSMPTLMEMEDEGVSRSHDDWSVPVRTASMVASEPGIHRAASMPSKMSARGAARQGGEGRTRAAQVELEQSLLREMHDEALQTEADAASRRNVLAGGYTTRSASPIGTGLPLIGVTPDCTASVKERPAGAGVAPGGVVMGGETSPTEVEWEPPVETARRRKTPPTGSSDGSPLTERTGHGMGGLAPPGMVPAAPLASPLRPEGHRHAANKSCRID